MAGLAQIVHDPSAQFLHLGENVGRFGKGRRGVLLAVPHDAISVHNDYSTVWGAALLIPQAVRLGHLPYGMEVGQQGVRDGPQTRRKCPVAVLAVTAYAQHLGTLLLELPVQLAERGDLVGSTACEIKYIKGEYNMFLALILTQAHFVTRLRRKTEIRGRLSDFGCHRYTSFR